MLALVWFGLVWFGGRVAESGWLAGWLWAAGVLERWRNRMRDAEGSGNRGSENGV